MLKKGTFIVVFLFAGLLFAVESPSKPENLDTLLEGIDLKSNTASAAPAQDAVVTEVTPAPAPEPVTEPAPAKDAVVAEVAPAPEPVVEPTIAPVPDIAPAPASAPAPAKEAVVAEVAPAPVPATAPSPTPTLAEKEKIDGPLYHYAYAPDESMDDNSKPDKFSHAGHPGVFFLSFLGQGVLYKDSNKGVPGFGIEAGLQFNLFKYLSLVGAMNVAYRKGFVSGDKLYPFGALGQVRLRVLPWLYPFFEAGVECVKVSRSGWQTPAKVLGGGLMIRMGYADKKAEYNLYKTVHITRTMLILAFDHTKVKVM
jgi:hypothetical protein